MKYRIEVGIPDAWKGSPVEFAHTMAHAKKIRTWMARGTQLPSRAIVITKNKEEAA